MPAADFAAAQERIAARRARHAHTHPTPPRTPLPFRLNTLAGAWSALHSRTGTRPAFRVGQVDAELLDDELLSLLRTQVSDGLQYFGSHVADTYAAEILLALRLVLFKLSIWNNNASYGAHLQGLRYADARSKALSRPPPTAWQKIALGVVSVGGRYAWGKWEERVQSAVDDYSSPSDTAAWARITDVLTTTHDIASLASFLVFLVNGRYRTLTDRLLRLRLTPSSHSTSREVSFEYLNRQLVWHAFTEFLLFLLPLVGISRWRRIVSRSLRRLKSAFLSLIGRSPPSSDDTSDDSDVPSGPLATLPERTCAICYFDQTPSPEALTQSVDSGNIGILGSAGTDITNPYAASCGCVYCFSCIAQRIAREEGEGWSCLRCGSVVKECAPWDGDVVERKDKSTTKSKAASTLPSGHRSEGKSVVFAQEQYDDEEDDGLRVVDPQPEDDESNASDDEKYTPQLEAEDEQGMTKPRSLDLADSLAFTESSEWARDDDDENDGRYGYGGGDEDSQSEEYDEDEEQEGEELAY